MFHYRFASSCRIELIIFTFTSLSRRWFEIQIWTNHFSFLIRFNLISFHIIDLLGSDDSERGNYNENLLCGPCNNSKYLFFTSFLQFQPACSFKYSWNGGTEEWNWHFSDNLICCTKRCRHFLWKILSFVKQMCTL